jgi:hypothetical protein
MNRNGHVVYDSEGHMVCSAIVPSGFRKTLTGMQASPLAATLATTQSVTLTGLGAAPMVKRTSGVAIKLAVMIGVLLSSLTVGL